MRLWVPKTTAPVSLSHRSCFCLGHGHKLPAGHRAGGGCLESCGDDRQTAGEPNGFICVQWGPAHSLTSEEQGTELMKPWRARLPAPTPSLLEHGSRDNCRLQQASPSPKYFVISCLFSIHRTESSFSSSFLESSCDLQDEGRGAGFVGLLLTPELCD